MTKCYNLLIKTIFCCKVQDSLFYVIKDTQESIKFTLMRLGETYMVCEINTKDMETVYIVERLSTNEAFEAYDHCIAFVTNDLTFANNKIKKLVAEEIDAFNTNNDAVGNPETCEKLNDTSYVINHNASRSNQTLIEYEITKHTIL